MLLAEIKDIWGDTIKAPVTNVTTEKGTTVYEISKEGDNTFHVGSHVPQGRDVRITRVVVDKSGKTTIYCRFPMEIKDDEYDALLIKIHRLPDDDDISSSSPVKPIPAVNVSVTEKKEKPKVNKAKAPRAQSDEETAWYRACAILNENGGSMSKKAFAVIFRERHPEYKTSVNFFIRTRPWERRMEYDKETKVLSVRKEVLV
jgi:3-dehydroquinate synthase class II